MRPHPVLIFASVLLLAAVAFLGYRTALLERDRDDLRNGIGLLEDSLSRLELVVDSLKSGAPGLGEYMSTMQLHAAKLWFAGRASNWPLARYELDELEETMAAAGSLHAMKNAVDVFSVLESVRLTQLQALDSAIAARSGGLFESEYARTLEACNSCHSAAGYGFIHIVLPSREPVANQRWDAPGR